MMNRIFSAALLLGLSTPASVSGAAYDLQGRKVLDARRGIYVQDGRVYL